MELLHPLLGTRDLEPARRDVGVELGVLPDAVEREERHLLRVVDREDEVRGVAGRAPGIRQRALVEEHDVGPTQLGEVEGEARAHDPAADDDGACLARE